MITIVNEVFLMAWDIIEHLLLPLAICLIILAIIGFLLYWFLIYPCRVLWRLFHGMGFFEAISDIREEDKLEDIASPYR